MSEIISTKNYTPMSDWVLVRKEIPKVIGSLEMPEISQNARAKYFVAALGAKVKLQVKIKDEVILTPDTWAVPVEPESKDLFLVKQDNICGVVSNG